MEQEVNAYFVPISEEGKILVVRRKNGIWEFPGGGVEFGEDPEESAIRELHEETGLRAQSIRFLTITSAVFDTPHGKKHAIYVVYMGFVKGKVDLKEEHDEYKWVSLNQLFQIPLGYNAKSIPQKIQELMGGKTIRH